jgi:hypothetical protein
MTNIKSQIEDLQNKIKDLRTRKREEKLQKLQSQYDKLTLKKQNELSLSYSLPQYIPIVFNTFFTKTDDINDRITLNLIWDTIKTSDEYNIISNRDKKIYGRDYIYKYVMEMCNTTPNPNSHKPIIVRGVRLISI